MTFVQASLVGLLLSVTPTSDGQSEAVAAKIAEKYLVGVTGNGDERARDLLLGGSTMDAQIFSLENWRIVAKEPFKSEEGDLVRAVRLMSELDRAGHESARKLMKEKTSSSEMTMHELSQAEAAKLLAPTQERANRFSKTCPLLAYVARVGKPVYWHPKNPMRPLLARAGKHGKYVVQLRRFKIETREGPRQVAREWPLRVVRIRTENLDTGWKILPASDWDTE